MFFLEWMGNHPFLTILILWSLCFTVVSVAEALRRR